MKQGYQSDAKSEAKSSDLSQNQCYINFNDFFNKSVSMDSIFPEKKYGKEYEEECLSEFELQLQFGLFSFEAKRNWSYNYANKDLINEEILKRLESLNAIEYLGHNSKADKAEIDGFYFIDHPTKTEASFTVGEAPIKFTLPAMIVVEIGIDSHLKSIRDKMKQLVRDAVLVENLPAQLFLPNYSNKGPFSAERRQEALNNRYLLLMCNGSSPFLSATNFSLASTIDKTMSGSQVAAILKVKDILFVYKEKKKTNILLKKLARNYEEGDKDDHGAGRITLGKRDAI
jgi:hypothetical protein